MLFQRHFRVLIVVAAVAACTSSTEPRRHPDMVSLSVGPAGGTFASKDGALTLTVPAGAVPSATTLSITPLDVADLGPEFSGLPATRAYELEPSGIVFAAPLIVTVVTTAHAVLSDSGISLKLGGLATSAGGLLQGLDSAALELRGDTIVLTGRLSHFSPLVEFIDQTEMGFVIRGVPAEMPVGGEFTATVELLNPTAFTLGDVDYVDFSGAGVEPTSLPGGEAPLSLVAPTLYRGAFPYTCTAVGEGRFVGAVSFYYRGPAGDVHLGLGNQRRTVLCNGPTLTVERTGEAAYYGVIQSTPAGINCSLTSTDCEQEFNPGEVILTASTTAPDAQFVAWSGDCSGTNASYAIIVTGDRHCVAEFAFIPSYNLAVTMTGAGSGTVSSSPAGIACGDDCQESYIEFTLVTLTATPSEMSDFVGWGGDCDAGGTVVMDAAKACTAEFSLKPQFKLIAEAIGTGQGFMTSSPAGIGCIVHCEQTYLEFTLVTLTAEADAGSVFRGWSGDCAADGTVLMDADKTCFARFDAIPVISALEPATATARGEPFVINVHGMYFVADASTVYVGETPLVTTFVSSGQLTGTVPATEMAGTGDKAITVRTADVGSSAPFTFTVINPAPELLSLTPSSVAAGSPAFTLGLFGDKFAGSATVTFNGTPVTTTWLGWGGLQAAIPAALVTEPGTVPVTVTNPGPAGGTATMNFTITPAADPCAAVTPLEYGTVADGSLAPGDCEQPSDGYVDRFTWTTPQVANLVTLTGPSSIYAELQDGALGFGFILGTTAGTNRRFFGPPGSYGVSVRSSSGSNPEAAYSILVGAGGALSMENCENILARPGIDLGTQSLANSDCAGFNRPSSDAGFTCYDYVNLVLATGEAVTVTMTAGDFTPVIMVYDYNEMGIPTIHQASGSGGTAQLALTGQAGHTYRVEFSSPGQNHGPTTGAYQATIVTVN